MSRTLRNFFGSRFFWIMFVSFTASVFFLKIFIELGGWTILILATTLYAQSHFLMAYFFSFEGLKRKLSNSTLAVFFIYGAMFLLVFGPFRYWLEFSTLFWGFMAIAGFFLLHFYENILFFLETSFPGASNFIVLTKWERRFFYFTLASFAFSLYLISAASYGPRFGFVAIRLQEIGSWPFILSAGLTGVLLALLFYFSRNRRAVMKLSFIALGMTAALFFIGTRYLSFFGLIYFVTVWHFSMWNVFYLWKLWVRTRSISFLPVSANTLPQNPFSGFVAYAASGPTPFLVSTLLLSFLVVVYFLSDYPGGRQALLFH